MVYKNFQLFSLYFFHYFTLMDCYFCLLPYTDTDMVLQYSINTLMDSYTHTECLTDYMLLIIDCFYYKSRSFSLHCENLYEFDCGLVMLFVIYSCY